MANSPNDGRSGGGPLDTDQAERLAELFQASWEAGPTPGPSAVATATGAGAQKLAPPPAPKPKADNPDRWGSTTAPEAPAANAHKKTLVGLPVPTPVMPVSKSSVSASPRSPLPAPPTSNGPVDSPRDVTKRTLLGVAPPAPARGPTKSTPPPVKVPSHAPPPPPPPPDAAEIAAWENAERVATAGSRSPEAPPSSAAKSSPRSSRPSGVAKAYVPKEDAHTPAVVVDEGALRDGLAAAAAEEARRKARAAASRAAKTMRARPGELDIPIPPEKKGIGGWIAVGVVVLGAAAAIFFVLRPTTPDAPPPNVAAEANEPAVPDNGAAIPTVASPEALPVEAPAAPAPPPAEPEAPEVAATPVRAPKQQPATRQAPSTKRATETASSPRPEPQKKTESPKKAAEPSKKQVIVRDAPF